MTTQPFVLHIDNEHPDLDRRFTVHIPGCQHANLGGGRRGGGVFREPVTGMDDPKVAEIREMGWKVTAAPRTKKLWRPGVA